MQIEIVDSKFTGWVMESSLSETALIYKIDLEFYLKL